MIETLWILLIIFLLVDVLLVSLRASLLNIRITFLVSMREVHPDRVENTLALLEKPRIRISLRIWVVLIHLMLALVGSWLFVQITGALLPWPFAIALMALGGILLLILEFTLEGMILPRAERLAVRFVPLVKLLDYIISPLSAVLMLLLGSPKMLENRMSAVTEDELKTWAQEGQPEGSLEMGERRMIYSIFQFGDTMAREVMVPRIDILALDVTTPLKDAIQVLTQSGHSRVPVYDTSVDHIIGLLYAKDLLRVHLEDQSLASIKKLLRPAYFVPETKKVDELLREMQSRSVHMALVVDEYGGIAGMVTMEDIVEEIVGEIRDEYDLSEELLFEQVAANEFIFQGRIDLNDFNEITGAHLQKDVADTLGGFIYAQLGRVPIDGEQIEVENLVLIVEQVIGRRIRTVRALIRTNEPEPEEHQKEDETER